jgi:hypothetical protein
LELMDALAAAASTFRSAIDDNSLDELARPQGRVAASRVEGHFPTDELLPAHANGHEGGAALSDAEDAIKQVVANPNTLIRTPCV